MILSTAQILKDDHLMIVRDHRFGTKSVDADLQLGKRKNELNTDQLLEKTRLADIFNNWPNNDDTTCTSSADKEEYSYVNGYYGNYFQANLQIMDRWRKIQKPVALAEK